MHTEPRTGPIEKLVLHVNVGPEVQGGAHGLASYLTRIDAGYHAIFDEANTVVVAPDNVVVWAASGMNSRGLHGCLIGYADQSPEQWADAYSRAELTQAARWFAEKCKTYEIPVRRLSAAEVEANGTKGICGHVDVTAAFGGNNDGHYDPGPHFPWTVFLSEVEKLMKPVDWAAVVKLVEWRNRVAANPLEYRHRGPDIQIMNDLFHAKRILTFKAGDGYGARSRRAVYRFKRAHPEIGNTDGKSFGGPAADVLLR